MVTHKEEKDSLFQRIKEQFEDIPEIYVTVYNFTQEASVDSLGELGLKPLAEGEGGSREKSNERLAGDLIFDKLAPKGFSRTHSVYGYEDISNLEHGSMGEGSILMEIKINPKDALVADADDSGEGLIAYRDGSVASAHEWAEQYWKRAIPLEEFLKLSPEEKKGRFYFPEVVIPHSIPPEHMRIAAVKLLQDR